MRKFLKALAGPQEDSPELRWAKELIKAREAEQEHLAITAKDPGSGPPDGFEGEFTYANRERAQGEFRGGKLNGKGRFFSTKQGDSGWRVGSFCENKLHGQGRAYDESQPKPRVVREGTFHHGKLQGEGHALMHLDEPEYRYDKLEATGHFENDVLTHGKVVYLDKRNPVTSIEGTFVYKAEHKNIFPIGKCTRVLRNGLRQEMVFAVFGVEERSFGVWTYPDGERWEGTLYNGNLSKGQRYDAQGNPRDGDIHHGEWFPREEYERKVAEEEVLVAKWAREERESKERDERLQREWASRPPGDSSQAARVAAGWSAMQHNPANAWVAGGVWNP